MVPSGFTPSKPQSYSINARINAVRSSGQLQAKAMGKTKDSRAILMPTNLKWNRQHRKIYVSSLLRNLQRQTGIPQSFTETNDLYWQDWDS